MTPIFHALLMLGTLGGVTFAAAAAPRGPWLAATAAGFVVAAAVSGLGWQFDAATAGLVASCGAIVYLFWPRYAWLSAGLGGALAGMSIGLFSAAGLPFPLAVLLMAIVMAGTVWLTRTRVSFAPESLREEALLAIGAMGLIVAVLPSVLDGWQAAMNLNVRMEQAASQAIPVWTMSLVATSTLLGAAYALWSRR